jgi:hypothetical protein
MLIADITAVTTVTIMPAHAGVVLVKNITPPIAIDTAPETARPIPFFFLLVIIYTPIIIVNYFL